MKLSSKIDKKWHVIFWLTPSLPHVSFGDTVVTPHPTPKVSVSRIIWMALLTVIVLGKIKLNLTLP